MNSKPNISNNKHLAWGFIISALCFAVPYYYFSFSIMACCAIGVCCSFVAGLMKEVKDGQESNNQFDALDLIYTVLGGVIFCAIAVTLHYAT